MSGLVPQQFIDELLSRIDIVDVINHRVTLKKRGANYMACCPFHNEKTPSFSVNQGKQIYYCFGCKEAGNAIKFLMEYEGMHFVDAIETLAESVSMEVPRDESTKALQSNNRPLYVLMESVVQFYQQQLKEHPEAIAYLKNRGLSGETAKQFGIGFAPDGWDKLNLAFPNDEAKLVSTGMLIKSDNDRSYQRFRNRIMFPILDRRGRAIAFGGRVITDEEPKYLNSPETPLFHKGNELYGLYEARKSAQEHNLIFVVEGYMDVVSLAQHGVNNAVATLGTAANQTHSELLFRVVPNIVFCFDGDNAGRSAAWRALTGTLPCLQDGRDADFLFLAEGEDPDSIAKQHGGDGFRALLKHKRNIIDFLFDHLSNDIDTTSISGKAMLADKARPLLNTLPSGIYKKLAIQKLEKIVGLSLGSKHIPSAPPKTRPQPPAPPSNAQHINNVIMKRTLLLVLQFPHVVHSLPPEDIEYDPNMSGAAILGKLIAYCDANPDISTARLLERFSDTQHYALLQALAVHPAMPDNSDYDSASAEADFKLAMDRLRRNSQKAHSHQLPPTARKGLLSRPRKR